MSILRISAFQELQNWHAAQRARTDNVIGSSGAGSLVDNSAAFTSVASGYYTVLGNLAGRAALSRVQDKVIAATAKKEQLSLDVGLQQNRAVGQAILAQFGLGGGSSTKPKASASTVRSAYKAPVNAATGYGYTKISAAGAGLLSAVNLLA